MMPPQGPCFYLWRIKHGVIGTRINNNLLWHAQKQTFIFHWLPTYMPVFICIKTKIKLLRAVCHEIRGRLGMALKLCDQSTGCASEECPRISGFMRSKRLAAYDVKGLSCKVILQRRLKEKAKQNNITCLKVPDHSHLLLHKGTNTIT